MSEPVTWLMPVKNGMPYLPLTLESIAAQTYRNHSIIVWDNGSTDGTIEELRRWIPARIPGVIFTGKPLSVGASAAALVEAAQSELCARADADDIHLPARLETQVAHMLAHPEVVALGSQAVIIDSAGKPTGAPWTCPLDDAETRWLTRWQSGLIHPAVMFRRSAVLRAGNYADMKSEDSELWIRLCPFGEIYSLPDVLIHYRRHEASESGSYTDFFEGQLRAARHAVAHLFPSFPAGDALALWERIHPQKLQQPGTAELRNLSQLSRAATLLARHCGRPEDYFKNTPTFHLQTYWLRRRLVQRFRVSKLADMSRQLRARVRGTEPIPAR